MFCPECGNKVRDEAKFCASCGARLDSGETENEGARTNAPIASAPRSAIPAASAESAVPQAPAAKPPSSPARGAAWSVLGVLILLIVAGLWGLQSGMFSSLGLSSLTNIGSSFGKPGATEAKAVFQHQLAAQLRGVGAGAIPFEIVSFSKTNGQTRSIGGEEAYTFEYVAVVVFPQGIRPECVSRNGGFTGWDCYAFQASVLAAPGLGAKSAGERQEFKGELSFEKTERGWKGPDGSVY